jgi:hypothetical protein
MTFQGHIENGNVVFDSPTRPPDGSVVEIAVISPPQQIEPKPGSPTLGEKLLKFAGKAVDLPADAAAQHDHYLYGTPKR